MRPGRGAPVGPAPVAAHGGHGHPRAFGLEASQAVLGHAELGVTQVYAEVDQAAARRVMGEIG